MWSSIGKLGQWLSLFATSYALYRMIGHHARLGDDIATTSAIVLTIATKIRYYGPLFLASSRRRKLKKAAKLPKAAGGENL